MTKWMLMIACTTLLAACAGMTGGGTGTGGSTGASTGSSSYGT